MKSYFITLENNRLSKIVKVKAVSVIHAIEIALALYPGFTWRHWELNEN